MAEQALIVVDMLNDFIEEGGALDCGPAARAIVPFIGTRLDAFRRTGDPVIFLCDAHAPDDREFEKFPRHCVTGTRGAEIIPALAPLAGETVIAKTRYSGFYGTDLERILAAEGLGTVEVVGVCTSICVMDTVGGLANRDYRVRVPADGVADFDPRMHAFALKRMKQLYGAEVS